MHDMMSARAAVGSQRHATADDLAGVVISGSEKASVRPHGEPAARHHSSKTISPVLP
jgi:hypothetical protein